MTSSSQVNIFDADGLTTLPLKKFSFVTTPASRGKLLWTHLPQRDNLFAVFDFATGKDLEGLVVKKRFLRFVRGDEILEEVNLAELAYQARLDTNTAGSQSQPISDAQRIMVIIVKKPMMAIRYQLPSGMIRRLQINFDPTSGYDKALELLLTLSIPIENRDAGSEDQSGLGSAPDTKLAALPTAPLGLLPAPNSSTPRIHAFNGRLQAGITLTSEPNMLPVGVSKPAEARSGTVDTTRRSLFQREIAETRRPATTTTPLSDDTLSQLLPPKRILPFPDLPARSRRQENAMEGALWRSNVVGEETGVTKKQKTKRKGAVPKTIAAAVCRPSPNIMAPPSSSAPVIGGKQADRDIRTFDNTIPSGSLQQRAEATDTLAGPGISEPSAHGSLIAIGQNDHTSKQVYQSPGFLVSAEWVAEVNKFMRDHRKGAGRAGAVEDTFTTEFKDTVNTFMEEHKHCSAAVVPTYSYPPASGLAEFTALSKIERSEAMDALMVECLNDDEFICLVDEVDESWQRVGLKF